MTALIRPLATLNPIKTASLHWGNIGKTTTYRLIAKHKVQIVRFDGSAKITAEDILRVAQELIAESNGVQPAKGGRALAAKSVAARKRTRRVGV